MKYLFFLLLSFFIHFSTAQHSGFANSGNFEIYYEIMGKGHPVLMLQGGPGYSSAIMKSLANQYKDDYQIIIFDPRGIGKSRPENWSDSDITLSQMVEDIEAVRKAVKIKKWAVYGKSWGGPYAAAYMAKYPESVSSLVLSASPGVSAVGFAHLPLDGALTAKNRARLKEIRTKNDVQISQIPWRLRKDDTENRKSVAALMNTYTNDKEVYSRKLANVVFNDIFASDFNVKPKLQKSQIPTLILHGRDDFVPVQIAINFYKIKPNAELIIFEQSSHSLEKDEPEKFDKAFRSFLNENFN